MATQKVCSIKAPAHLTQATGTSMTFSAKVTITGSDSGISNLLRKSSNLSDMLQESFP